jgi:hypothetical protein
MENVLASFVVVFIILFAVLTLSHTFLASQDTMYSAWEDMEARYIEQSRTQLTLVDATIAVGGGSMDIVLRNDGATRLADFDLWDVISQYYETADFSGYHIDWLPYIDDEPLTNEWSAIDIYMDADQESLEIYEPTILNPGEELLVRVSFTPHIGPGTTSHVRIVTENGNAISAFATRNHLPVLAQNMPITIGTGGNKAIDVTHLQTTDVESTAPDLIYAIAVAPEQGTLSFSDTFSQQDINDGLLFYTHTGSGDDSFQFTVADDEYVIGTYEFIIGENLAPTLTVNTGTTILSGGSTPINNTMLQITDGDNAAGELIYTVTSAPQQGTLSLDGSFMQNDIDTNRLIYTHSGTGSDSFAFSVSDGESTIGTYVFDITVN